MLSIDNKKFHEWLSCIQMCFGEGQFISDTLGDFFVRSEMRSTVYTKYAWNEIWLQNLVQPINSIILEDYDLPISGSKVEYIFHNFSTLFSS